LKLYLALKDSAVYVFYIIGGLPLSHYLSPLHREPKRCINYIIIV